MGRLILKYGSGRLESLKCKSKARAEEIARKIPSLSSWNYYENNQKIPDQRKVEYKMPSSFEELDRMIKSGELK